MRRYISFAIILGSLVGCGDDDISCLEGGACRTDECEGTLSCDTEGVAMCVCDSADASVRPDAGDAAVNRDAGEGDADGADAGPVDAGPPPPVRAFPSAIGAGAYTTGGRAGQVIHVTTLDWMGPGSFHEALTAEGPRTIVFDVSGEIDATAQPAFEPIIRGAAFGDITIAGQTAPAGGITIRTNDFSFQDVDNIIIRYVRFRVNSGSRQDAMWLIGSSHVVIDHCTFSHGGDEAIDVGSGVSGAVSIQRNFFQDSKTGTIIGASDDDGDFTFALNLYTNISHRFPNTAGDGHYDIVNNVVYNWKNRLVRITSEGTYNVLNNYYLASAGGLRLPGWYGPSGDLTPVLQKVQTQADDDPLIFAAGSLVMPTQRTTPMADDRDMFTVFAASHLPEGDPVPDQYFADAVFPIGDPQMIVLDAEDAFLDVLADVGANRTLDADGAVSFFLDDKDAADLQMVRDDSYSGDFYADWNTIPHPAVPANTRPADFDTDRDGMPDAWETRMGFDPSNPSDGTEDEDEDGYTNLEEYLNAVDAP